MLVTSADISPQMPPPESSVDKKDITSPKSENPAKSNTTPPKNDMAFIESDIKPTKSDMTSTTSDTTSTKSDMMPTNSNMTPTKSDTKPAETDNATVENENPDERENPIPLWKCFGKKNIFLDSDDEGDLQRPVSNDGQLILSGAESKGIWKGH